MMNQAGKVGSHRLHLQRQGSRRSSLTVLLTVQGMLDDMTIIVE